MIEQGARGARLVGGAMLLAALLSGCAGPSSPDDATRPSPSGSPSPTMPTAPPPTTAAPEPEAEPAPEPEAEATPAVEPGPEAWVDFVSSDGAIAFSHPASWRVIVQQQVDASDMLTLELPDGSDALDVSVSRADAAFPATNNCDDPAYEPYPFEVLASEPVAPLAGAVEGSSPAALELVTFALPDADFAAIMLLDASHVASGCLDGTIVVPGGAVQAATPYGTDAPGLVYDLFDGVDAFLASDEHDAILEVLRSLEVRSLGG